jgi:small subunit ribosomal protein S13
MARIAGIDLPKNKRGEIGLTYIYGVGRSRSREILIAAGVDINIKVQDWTDDQLQEIRNWITDNVKVEGELRGNSVLS